jgi:hypothetical protein
MFCGERWVAARVVRKQSGKHKDNVEAQSTQRFAEISGNKFRDCGLAGLLIYLRVAEAEDAHQRGLYF